MLYIIATGQNIPGELPPPLRGCCNGLFGLQAIIRQRRGSSLTAAPRKMNGNLGFYGHQGDWPRFDLGCPHVTAECEIRAIFYAPALHKIFLQAWDMMLEDQPRWPVVLYVQSGVAQGSGVTGGTQV